MTKHGSVTVLMKNRGYGGLRGEDGTELYFDENSMEAQDFRTMSVGDRVEYEEQYWGKHVRVVKIRPIASLKTGFHHN
jgi:hypothetical protein